MYTIGIDLGTVYTAAATWHDGHTEIFSLGSRSAVIPSVVLVREDASSLVGEAAVRRALLEPSRIAREFKRRFGDSTPIMLGGSPHSPESLTARLLARVVSDVTTQMGGPPEAVCVCHPANWGPYKSSLLQQAVRIADLRVPVAFAIEPVAAAAYYAQQERVPAGCLVAVYDLGGGTFDSAVVRVVGDGSFEIVGRPEGIDHLGGADFDAAVFEHVQGVVGGWLESLDDSSPAAVAAVARLRTECTAAKEALSADTDTSIAVLLPNTVTEVRLTRAELERMIRPPLYDTIAALQRAIRSAGVTPEDLHSVLLIGGSSRIPLVAQLVGAELGRPVAVDAHPKHEVALGAALIARTRPAETGTDTPTMSATRVPAGSAAAPACTSAADSAPAEGSSAGSPAAGGSTTRAGATAPGGTAPNASPLPPAAGDNGAVTADATTAAPNAPARTSQPSGPPTLISGPTAPARATPAPEPAPPDPPAPLWRRGLAAAVIALAAVVALVAVGILVARTLGRSPPPTTAVTSGTGSSSSPVADARATTAAATIPAPFAGTWSGVLYQPPGSTTGDNTTITMSAGSSTASYALPHVGCQAVLTVTAAPTGSTSIQLSEQLTTDPSHRCAARAQLTIALVPGSDLHQIAVFWQDAANPGSTARGILSKRDQNLAKRHAPGKATRG